MYGVLSPLADVREPSNSKHPEPLTPIPIPMPRITFSYSCRDLREYRETFPSWLVLQAFRIQSGDASLSYPDLAKALGTPVSIVPSDPAHALTDAGWWLSQLKSVGHQGPGRRCSHSSLRSRVGCMPRTQRASEAFTEFDGHVPAAGKVLDPSASREAGVSDAARSGGGLCVSPLPAAGARRHCARRAREGRRYVARRRHSWLGAARSLCGDAAAQSQGCRPARCEKGCCRGFSIAGRPASRSSASRCLRRRRRCSIANAATFSADLELFLLEECDREPTRTPVGLEVSFGYPLDEDDEDGEPEALAQEDPVVVDLGGGLTFKLAGRIDRIDQIGEGTFEIIDYKTGGYYAPKWASGVFSGGTRLQHALYGLAAAQLLRRKYKRREGRARHLLLLECQGWQGASVDRDAQQGGARRCALRSARRDRLGHVHSRRG